MNAPLSVQFERSCLFESPVEFQSSGPSSSPVRARSGALAPDPVEPPAPRFTGKAGAVPPPAPASNSGTSCIRTEDGTVILFDRMTGHAVSGLTRAAAEAALLRLGPPGGA
ncbi:hypothetical protein FJW06_16180 [Mesorhizobium sp. B4-1-3]|nr:hypothetical protein FJW06_16180 [Mesorhizobium sp. B4-1-3]